MCMLLTSRNVGHWMHISCLSWNIPNLTIYPKLYKLGVKTPDVVYVDALNLIAHLCRVIQKCVVSNFLWSLSTKWLKTTTHARCIVGENGVSATVRNVTPDIKCVVSYDLRLMMMFKCLMNVRGLFEHSGGEILIRVYRQGSWRTRDLVLKKN